MNPTAFEYGNLFIEQASAAERIETTAECEVQDDFCTETAEWLIESDIGAAVISCQSCASSIWLHPKANGLDEWAVAEKYLSEYENVVDRFVPIEEYLESPKRLRRRKEYYPDAPITFVNEAIE